MIAGRVNEHLEAIIPVQLRGDAEPIPVVIDTGFQGPDLMLPRAVMLRLGLAPEGSMAVWLGNEQPERFNYYIAEVAWQDGFKRVRILESETECLAGVNLLAGSRITIELTPGGTVAIEEPPAL